jgi:hypothetical protein
LARNCADGEYLPAGLFPNIPDEEILTPIQFGSMPLMISFTHGDKVYVHQTQDPAQFQVMESKKAQKRAVAKAKKERRELMLEARALLKNSVKADMNGNMEAAQRLRVQAANRRITASMVHAPAPGADQRFLRQLRNARRSSFSRLLRLSPST